MSNEERGMAVVKDYRVNVKVRNNRILKAIEAVGGTPGGKWCASVGLSYARVNDFVAMKLSPITKTGDLTALAKALCEATNSSAYDLWSDEQLRPLARNTAELEMSTEEIAGLMGGAGADGMAAVDAKLFVDRLLPNLSERARAVLLMRFYDGMTLADVGAALGMTGGLVRHIEQKALLKLRKLSGEYL